MATTSVVDLFRKLAKNEFGFFQKVRTIADIMTGEVHALTTENTLQHGLRLFEKFQIHHAPVIDSEKRDVVGVVSERDLLRHRPRNLGTPLESDLDHRAANTSLLWIMTRSVIHVSQTASPADVLKLMLDNHIDCVLVYEDPNELQGIVTPSNFISALLLFHEVCSISTQLRRLRLVDLDRGIPGDEIFRRGAQTVRDVFTADVATLNVENTVQDAIDLMQKLKVRHIPIVNKQGSLMGVVSDRDILRALTPMERRVSSQNTSEEFRSVLFATDEFDPSLRERLALVMNRELITVKHGSLLVEAMSKLLENRVNCLPVVDEDGKQLSGIISTTDVLRVFRMVMTLGSFMDTTAARPPVTELTGQVDRSQEASTR